MTLRGCILLWCCCLSGMCVQARTEIPSLPYHILATRAHDSQAFTQGLIVAGDDLVESSGLYGKSFVTRYHKDTGKLVYRQALPKSWFAEGLTLVDGSLYVLSWQAHEVLVLREPELTEVGRLVNEGEGWGLTYDGLQLISSDGSAQLTFRDLKTFVPLRRVTVRSGLRRWNMLNELEYAEGYIWANVWKKPLILVIDPAKGDIVAQLDLTALVKANQHKSPENVLNGIAYDAQQKAFWVTGKFWPKRYLIQVDSWPVNSDTAATIPPGS